MAAPQTTLPIHSNTNTSEDADVIPHEDSSEVTKLFLERLQAWKHACGYFEDYVKQTAKVHSSNASDYEKYALKAVNDPLKESHHFDPALGGITGLFENIKTNTQTLANSNAEAAKTLKGPVLDIFERLHAEIKHKSKELNKGAGKGAKAVDKSRVASQKHIELLGQHTAAFDSTSGGAVKASEDPYLLQRQVHHRLHRQVAEENDAREDMLAVQNNFSDFEAHVVKTFQAGIAQFNQVVGTNAEKTRALYGDMLGNAQKITPDHEWNGFVHRNANLLIDPTAPKRSVEGITFPNRGHRATQPLIAGVLERKSGLLKKYDGGYYAVTPSKYLHEFKSDDDFEKDPSPENSLYLPDCMIGAIDGTKFNVRGKDKSSLGGKLSMTKEFEFKAATPQDAQKWHSVIASITGAADSVASPVGTHAAETGVPATTAGTTGVPATTAGTTGVPTGTAGTTATHSVV